VKKKINVRVVFNLYLNIEKKKYLVVSEEIETYFRFKSEFT